MASPQPLFASSDLRPPSPKEKGSGKGLFGRGAFFVFSFEGAFVYSPL